MGLLIGIIFFLFEIVIILICYQFIYKQTNISGRSLWDIFRMLIGYGIFMLKYRFCPSLRNREMDDFLEAHSELRFYIYEKSLRGILGIVIPPIVVALIIHYQHMLWMSVLVFIIGLGEFLKDLKESRVVLMSFLNERQKFLFQFHRKKKNMKKGRDAGGKGTKETEQQEAGKNRAWKVLAVLLMIAFGDMAMILLTKNFPGMLENAAVGNFSFIETVFMSPFFVALVLGMLLMYGIFQFLDEGFRDNVKQKRNYRRHWKDEEDITVWVADENREELNGWIKEVLHMCCLLGIKEVELSINGLGVKKIVSVISDVHMPVIIIGRDVFERSKAYFAQEHFDIIKLLVAHELVHIHYKDAKWMLKVYRMALLYICISIFAIYQAAKTKNAVVLGIAVFLCLGYLVFHKLCDERYWKQVMEFRADRIGMSVSGTSLVILEKALKCAVDDDMDDGAEIKKGILYKIYTIKTEKHIHPAIERRIYEAKRNRPWGIKEYFRYLWLISWNVMKQAGWKI